ncbi:hypothetical protein [Roseivirga thermotolerans]|uniref:Peptidase C51 domain-containing protein n=1 Tax=Roseivirga thermotolerans TaxID=1758176 RepID=A0ABQ3IA99_9BACT|nr:hypothetical protein [Roseivirga thermotolerans]MEC7754813.1 hypothetical protein [Bacteroidota bacterium]GHE68921.1 hypothetical protein GCM10011340_26010 [Roseivirga thermotolerans]
MIVWLKRSIKGFLEPHPNSVAIGYLDKGHYAIKEIKNNFPSPETDYLKVQTLDFGEVWVCSRWQDEHYAIVNPDREEQPLVSSENLGITERITRTLTSITQHRSATEWEGAVEESVLLEELEKFTDEGYSAYSSKKEKKEIGKAYAGQPPHSAGFIEALLVQAWRKSFPDFCWSERNHRQMTQPSAEDYFSPVTACVESGMAVRQSNEDRPLPWSVVHGWKSQWKHGHTFISVAHHKATDAVLMLEAGNGNGLSGVGLRKLGALAELNYRVPEQWWLTPGIWSWNRVKKVYPYRSMASLKVKNLQWVKL